MAGWLVGYGIDIYKQLFSERACPTSFSLFWIRYLALQIWNLDTADDLAGQLVGGNKIEDIE